MKRETGIGVIISLMIIIGVVGFILISAINMVENLPVEEEDCQIVHHSLRSKNVVLRIDDIQAYGWNSIQEAIIRDSLERKVTLSLGVIPNRFEEGGMIYNLLKDNRCELEIALHGFNHNDNEFVNISYEEAKQKIEWGLENLKEIEPNIVTFIPPGNGFSEEPGKIIKEKFRINSAYAWNSKYGTTQTSYDWEELKLVPYEEIIEGCEKDFSAGKVCVIMIHPQDYATGGKLDLKKYQNYLGLIKGLKEINANFVNFRDLN